MSEEKSEDYVERLWREIKKKDSEIEALRKEIEGLYGLSAKNYAELFAAKEEKEWYQKWFEALNGNATVNKTIENWKALQEEIERLKNLTHFGYSEVPELQKEILALREEVRQLKQQVPEPASEKWELLNKIEALKARESRLREALNYLYHDRIDGLGRKVSDVCSPQAKKRVIDALSSPPTDMREKEEK
jgi:uncharacterized coiled-coil DUF342 family protein